MGREGGNPNVGEYAGLHVCALVGGQWRFIERKRSVLEGGAAMGRAGREVLAINTPFLVHAPLG